MINRVYGLLGLATRAGKIIYGTDACIENIEKDKVKLVIVATDSSDKLKDKLINKCQKKDKPIQLIVYGTMDELSKSIGKQNKAVIGVKDINFSNEIIKIINGGEVIG